MMSSFAYLAIAGSGERVQGTLSSHDRREAVRKLLDMGLHPLSVEDRHDAQQAPSAAELWRRWAYRVRVTDLAVFTRQLASLLHAGLPMVQALTTLRRQCDHRGLVRVLEDIEGTIGRDGSSLAEALDQHPRIFDPVYRGLIRAGEEGGHLVEVLQNMASHLARAAKLRGQVVGAFIYPIFLLVLGSVAVFVLMTFVIPQFQDLFVSFGQDLPLPTQVLVAISGFMAAWWWAVLAGLLAGCLLGLLMLRRPPVRERFDRWLLTLPVFGPMFLKLEVARIARTLGELLAGGVRIIQALRVTGETARNLAIRRTFATMASEVATGKPLAEAMQQSDVYPAMVISLVQTGEETGDLAEMLGELAAIYEEEAERAVNGSVKLLEPTLIVVMGLVIAGIVAAVILPIFQSSALVG